MDTTRRKFLLDSFKLGGVVACASLGFGPRQIAWADAALSGEESMTPSGEANQIYGNYTLPYDDERQSTNRTRATQIVVTATCTFTYGWFYASTQDENPSTFQMSIWNNARDAQQGSCSSSGTLPAYGSEAWNQVTFSPGIQVSAGTYWIAAHAAVALTFFDIGTDDGDYHNSDTCPTAPTTGTTYDPLLCAANYLYSF